MLQIVKEKEPCHLVLLERITESDQSSTDGDKGEADESEDTEEEEACGYLSSEESFSRAKIRDSGKGRLWTRNLSRKTAKCHASPKRK